MNISGISPGNDKNGKRIRIHNSEVGSRSGRPNNYGSGTLSNRGQRFVGINNDKSTYRAGACNCTFPPHYIMPEKMQLQGTGSPDRFQII
jgi:hypothetical protein